MKEDYAQKDFIRTWLKEHKYCVVTTSFEDKPWAATVNYTADDDLNIYISTDPNSLKFQNVVKNPTVCLVIDNQTKKGTLQIQGIAKTLKPENREDPNLVVTPEFLIFKRRGKLGKVETIELKRD